MMPQSSSFAMPLRALEDESLALTHWVQLALTEGIGPILTRRLIEAAGSAKAACAASIPVLSGIDGIGSAKARAIHESLQESCEEAICEIQRAESAGVSIICPDDQAYPTLLKSIPD